MKKQKRVLFVATVDSHIELFHLPYLKMFHDKGWEVHVATETGKKIPYCDKKIKLPIKRSPFKLISNYKAIRELRKIAKKEGYNIVHCHTPMGGVVARMACRGVRRHGTRMIYTAHGFHFYTGAPIHYWMMFYPVEWYLAKYTDTLITINDEDYQRAKKRFGKRCRDIQYVPGVGVDPKKFEKKLSAKEKHALRESLGLKDEDKVLICVGRLDKNKNQGFLIRAMKELVAKDARYHLLLVGPDEINGKYQELAKKMGVLEYVHFLGFREDIPELLQISNVAVSASRREGLPVNLIEAATLGLPIVATNCRGNRDVCEKSCGVLLKQKDIHPFVQAVLDLGKKSKNIRLFDAFEKGCISEKMNRLYGFYAPLVSVVVPAYNVSNYINKCLDSIIDQSYKNLEVIVVNDGSTDDTLMRIKSYKDERISVIDQKNQGLGAARNNGTKRARGSYILYVDSDDFLDSDNAIDEMVKEISKDDSDMLLFRFNYYYGRGSKKPSKSITIKSVDESPITVYSEMLKQDTLNISAWSKMIKLDVLNNNSVIFADDILSEDIDFSLELYSKVSKVSVSNNVYYNYRQNREGSITNVIDSKSIKSLIFIIDKWQKNNYCDIELKRIYLNYLAYQYSILLALSNDENTTPSEKRWIRDNVGLLKYDLNFKVKLSRRIYNLFGFDTCVGVLKKYNTLKNRGVVKI